MQLNRVLVNGIVAAVVLGSPAVALSEQGHDHTAAAGTAFPRFAAVSETFELVGVFEDRRLTLYLDRAADNSPVKDAQLTLELGGTRVDVKPHGEGEFQATLAEALKPGVVAVTAKVIAGADTELLAGELDLHAGDAGHSVHNTHTWKEYGAWTVGGLAGLALFGWMARRLMRRRAAGLGGAQ